MTFFTFFVYRKLKKRQKTETKTKKENVQNGQEKYGGEKSRAYAHLGQNFKNIKISSNFSLKSL